jgi:hypothetical protein
MKALQDKNGLTVHVDLMTGYDHAARVLDGSPYLQRKLRLLQGRKHMSQPGHYVHGLDELERELSELARAHDGLPENDAWCARLVSPVDLPSGRRHWLEVRWYQDGGDPFLRLAAMVSTLDFTLYSAPEIAVFFIDPPQDSPYGMRPMKDRNGLSVTIEMTRGDFSRGGMTEGTPYLDRCLRLRQGRRQMERAGTYVDGLDALEREIAQLSEACEVWAPKERWFAKVVTETDRHSSLRQYVAIYWFQEDGDPMARLAAMIADLDLTQYCASELVDQD